MDRQELLRSPEYWTTDIQISFYNCAEQFMRETGKNRAQLAEYLGVTKGYVTQLLNGDYDHRLSKLVKLSLAFGYVPRVRFEPINNILSWDKKTSMSSSLNVSDAWVFQGENKFLQESA